MSNPIKQLQSNVLDKIVNQRKIALQHMQHDYPKSFVAEAARQAVASKSILQAAQRVSLIKALQTERQAQRPGFLLECKKASPSKGLIRADFDPVALAKAYQPYATGISVLTEPDFFQGSFEYLAAVKAQVSCPVLCKDFIFSRYQVALARYFSADAILLMLSILDDATYQELAEYAAELELDVLTEVSNETETKRAVALNAPLIGINNRDLTTLEVDLNQTVHLAKLIPNDRLVLSESGIYTHAQVRELQAHADGFLVGSSLTAQADVDLACRKLIYGNNKVCGLTTPAQAQLAAASGAAYGGLIFVQRSPRQVHFEQAQLITQEVSSLPFVGVFSAQEISAESCAQQAFELGLHAVQLHDLPLASGLETSVQEQAAESHLSDLAYLTYLSKLKQSLQALCAQENVPPIQIWLAISVSEPLTQLIEQLNKSGAVDLFVLDQGTGGSGQTFNWEYLPSSGREKILLAGGIRAENCQTALALNCAGLDINSGAEVRAGLKCPQLLTGIFTLFRKKN